MSRSCSGLRAASRSRSENSPWAFLSSERMTSLRSSTLLLAALAPAPVSSEAVSRPLITRVKTPTLKNEMNFSWASISLRAADVDFTRHVEHSTLSQSRVSRAGEEAGPRCLRGRLQREHLDVPLADLHMVAMPRDRALYDLPVNASVAAELVAAGPLLQIEQIAEELEGFGLAEQLETERAAEVSFQQGCRLLKIGEHPGCVSGVLLRLALEGLDLRRLQRQAPVKVDTPKGRRLVEDARDGRLRTSPSPRSHTASAGEDRTRTSRACTDRGTILLAVRAKRLQSDEPATSSSRSVRASSSKPVREKRHP